MLSTLGYIVIALGTLAWGESPKPEHGKLFDRIDSLPQSLRENKQLPRKNQKVEQPKDLELLVDSLEKCIQRRVPDSYAQAPKPFDQIEKALASAREEFARDEALRKEIRNFVVDPSLRTEKAEKAFAEGKQIPSPAQIALREAESKKATYLLMLTNRIPTSLRDNFYLKGNDTHWAALVSYLHACEQAVLQPPQRSGTKTH